MKMITDKELEMFLSAYSQYETLLEKLIYNMAIELKTYRDLEKHGVLIRADWVKKGGSK